MDSVACLARGKRDSCSRFSNCWPAVTKVCSLKLVLQQRLKDSDGWWGKPLGCSGMPEVHQGLRCELSGNPVLRSVTT
jgi:hypothetical protein